MEALSLPDMTVCNYGLGSHWLHKPYTSPVRWAVVPIALAVQLIKKK